eukprot:CAMPEP_0183717738 /NCGR_PEP_ID=MMETSP0737-20130205/11251_1 /TAXON_ID=385413 /ORGANISM="Thalassiosira miniscula, Strain CCMP1093" /LENGTH=744 /DNA_ID=CAMNT_0025947215 /DNA_START=49 /DNA_END=2283 /DNA_ORIENTATION=+
MPLHEYLEQKRRKKIHELNRTGACHICECTVTRSFRRFVGNDDTNDGGGGNTNVDNPFCGESMVEDEDEGDISWNSLPLYPALQSPLSLLSQQHPLPMRTCMCHGSSSFSSSSSSNEQNPWPYSLRVCEMCLLDDRPHGRIRSCAVCGVVACDEYCGTQLVEATDRDAWNQAGCLECRGMESFREMELFRSESSSLTSENNNVDPNTAGVKRRPHGVPRATRVCLDCVELFSLFGHSGTEYHFECRYFHCKNLLVPSHVVELKRFLKPFPLSLLPEELLDSIVLFLGVNDLNHLGLACTSMFRKVEGFSRDVVTRCHDQLPTGPIKIINSEGSKRNNTTDTNTATADRGGEHHHSLVDIARKRMAVYAEGKNAHSLRAPEDGKTWIGVLHGMERLTRDIFYFGFQVKEGDEGAAMRYLRNKHKLSFDTVYSEKMAGRTDAGAVIAPYNCDGNSGLSVRGGQVLVTRYKWHHDAVLEDRREERLNAATTNHVRSIIFTTDKVLTSGIHRVIVRYYCFCEGESLGTIGILRRKNEGDTGMTSLEMWAQGHTIVAMGRMEEHVFGMEYDADARTLKIYKKSGRTNKMELIRHPGDPVRTLPPPPNNATTTERLSFAVSLSAGSAGIKGNQLSVRSCDEREWNTFLSHTAEKNLILRIRGRARRGEERLLRYLEHRARRAIQEHDEEEDAAAAMNHAEHVMDMLMEGEFEALNDDDNDRSDSDSEGERGDNDDVMQVEGVVPPMPAPL